MMQGINHKFHSSKFKNLLHTENAILNSENYQPEALILGTFNPDTPNSNFADFFYGRNYFWPAFFNIFRSGEVKFNRDKFEIYEIPLTSTRMPKRGKPKKEISPTIDDILLLCNELKLSFADMVLSVLKKEKFELLANDNVIFDGVEYNLIQDSKKNNIGGLEQLDKLGKVEWNTQNIIEYLKSNRKIKNVYFTRKPTGVWGCHFEKIKTHCTSENITITNIFTPSGQGKPVFNNMNRLIDHWLNNENPNFGKLESRWVKSNAIQ